MHFSLAVIGGVERDKRVETASESRECHALGRRHNGAARARDVAVFQCADEAEGRRSAATLAEERKV